MTSGKVAAGARGQDAVGSTGAADAAAGRSLPPARFSAQARLRALQADIMNLILERELEAGDPLPTENELSAVLGVGRNTLRESLKVLQALGVIEIRHGFGMFVAPNNFDALADGLTFRGRLSLRHQGQDALQLVDVRQALESGLIARAMDLMTAERLAAVEESVLRMEALAGAGENFVEADAEFHRRLFEPLDNELLASLLQVGRVLIAIFLVVRAADLVVRGAPAIGVALYQIWMPLPFMATGFLMVGLAFWISRRLRP